jgi:three-Cys-motif partner protein
MNRIKRLVNLGREFDDGKFYRKYGAHTLIKLIFLSSYAHQFSTIAKGPKASSSGYDAAVYVDLFSGPGIIGVDGRPDKVAGSPIAVTHGSKFDFSVFVDKSSKSTDLLASRLSKFLPAEKFMVLTGDCNEIIHTVVDEIGSRYKKPIVLAFVDPEGMEAHFETMNVLNTRFPHTDFIINMTAYADRVLQTLNGGPGGGYETFVKFFGWEGASRLVHIGTGELSEDVYIRQIADVLDKPVGIMLPVSEVGNRTIYNILAFTRQAGDDQWAKIMRHIGRQLAGLDGEGVLELLDVVMKRRGTLDSAFESKS